jgi:hypothetical protein
MQLATSPVPYQSGLLLSPSGWRQDPINEMGPYIVTQIAGALLARCCFTLQERRAVSDGFRSQWLRCAHSPADYDVQGVKLKRYIDTRLYAGLFRS